MDVRHINNPFEDYSEGKQNSIISNSGQDVCIKDQFDFSIKILIK